jgi:hypothetical protein
VGYAALGANTVEELQQVLAGLTQNAQVLHVLAPPTLRPVEHGGTSPEPAVPRFVVIVRQPNEGLMNESR